MKRRELLRHLEQHGCQQFREGRRHTPYSSRDDSETATAPSHSEFQAARSEANGPLRMAFGRAAS
jgi:predicted RNA binding protein YcfA (HicA-like mRNA interferase family)